MLKGGVPYGLPRKLISPVDSSTPVAVDSRAAGLGLARMAAVVIPHMAAAAFFPLGAHPRYGSGSEAPERAASKAPTSLVLLAPAVAGGSAAGALGRVAC